MQMRVESYRDFRLDECSSRWMLFFGYFPGNYKDWFKCVCSSLSPGSRLCWVSIPITWIMCKNVYRGCIRWSGKFALHWRHNDHDGVSNHQHHGCLLNRLFIRRSKKTSKLRVTGLCVGNSPGPVTSPHKWPVTRKMFPLDDVIMWLWLCGPSIYDYWFTFTFWNRKRYFEECKPNLGWFQGRMCITYNMVFDRTSIQWKLPLWFNNPRHRTQPDNQINIAWI